MATRTPTPQVPDTALYRLIAEKLGRDPVQYIRARRATVPPTPYAKIADEIKQKTGEYLTHEAPRRWLHTADRLAAEASNAAAHQAADAA